MKIYVWGTGCGASELQEYGVDPKDIHAFIDSFPSGPEFMGKPVLLPEDVRWDGDSFIIVSARQSGEISEKCAELGFDPERILFLRNHFRLVDINRSYDNAVGILGENAAEHLRGSVRAVRTPEWTSSPLLGEKDMENDWVRVAALVQAARRLESVRGAAAELGVYKGAFARCINALMPDRKLYLFDSFEGFDEKEAESEGKTGSMFAEAHRNTAEDMVLKRMPHPEQVVIRKGWFPETANDIAEEFAFVSLDVDLEESSYAGLAYFYPRLSPGGMIFLHDYSSPSLPGVSKAVVRYEAVLGEKLHAMPLPDVNGTLVIC
ncbi:MAG: class I SAM-dependent methyltransferase [Firmicutes bacterium]|nr:class I SAM-dependent methyltransferase [Bacillota bacterium]